MIFGETTFWRWQLRAAKLAQAIIDRGGIDANRTYQH
jgi:hypothetical protein